MFFLTCISILLSIAHARKPAKRRSTLMRADDFMVVAESFNTALVAAESEFACSTVSRLIPRVMWTDYESWLNITHGPLHTATSLPAMGCNRV